MEKSSNMGFGNDLLEMASKGKSNKTKNKQLGLHQTKKVSIQQNSKIKRQLIKLVKICGNHNTDKGLILQINKEFYSSTAKI